jgi:hypothetical protein
MAGLCRAWREPTGADTAARLGPAPRWHDQDGRRRPRVRRSRGHATGHFDQKTGVGVSPCGRCRRAHLAGGEGWREASRSAQIGGWGTSLSRPAWPTSGLDVPALRDQTRDQRRPEPRWRSVDLGEVAGEPRQDGCRDIPTVSRDLGGLYEVLHRAGLQAHVVGVGAHRQARVEGVQAAVQRQELALRVVARERHVGIRVAHRAHPARHRLQPGLLGRELAEVGLYPAVCLSSARGYRRTPRRACFLALSIRLASCRPCPAATNRRCAPSRLWPWPVTCWTATSARTRCWPSSRRCGSRLGSAAAGSRSRRPTTICSPWPFSWSSSGGRSDGDPRLHRPAQADLDGRPPRPLS